MDEWAVLEFDAERSLIWSAGPYDERLAREQFRHVTRLRSQRADVVQRARSAALLCRGQVVEASEVRASQRKPALGNKRLLSLDVDSRERIIGLELLGHELVRSSLFANGSMRRGAAWSLVRSTACDLWDLVRGSEADRVAQGRPVPGWWWVEWACACAQVERTQGPLRSRCPYHRAPLRRGPIRFEVGRA